MEDICGSWNGIEDPETRTFCISNDGIIEHGTPASSSQHGQPFLANHCLALTIFQLNLSTLNSVGATDLYQCPPLVEYYLATPSSLGLFLQILNSEQGPRKDPSMQQEVPRLKESNLFAWPSSTLSKDEYRVLIDGAP